MRRLFVRFAVVAAALSVGLMAASPAQAADGPAVLNSAHVGKTAGFQEDCTGPFKPLPSGYDGWHFILPAASGTSFLSVTLTFSSPGGAVTVGPITSTDAANPTKAGDNSWYAYIDNAGAAERHLYVFTAVGWTLTGGTADVTDASKDGFFNLSHTCKGSGTTSTATPGPTGTATPGPTGTPGVTESESVPGMSVSPSSTGGLPVTGAAWGAMVLTAFALIAAGVGLLAVRRRRELTENDAA